MSRLTPTELGLIILTFLVLLAIMFCASGCEGMQRMARTERDRVIDERIEAKVPEMIKRTTGEWLLGYLPHGSAGILALLAARWKWLHVKAEKRNGGAK